eukprot:g3565.t1
MKRLFSTRTQQNVPPITIQDASENLAARGKKLDDKISQLDIKLIKLREQIQQTRPGPSQEATKKRALQFLKQKRLYEEQRDQLYNQQFNLEQVSFATEFARDTAFTAQALQSAQEDLMKQMKSNEINIQKVDQVQDNVMDLMDRQQEVHKTLGLSYDTTEVDESELMTELAALESEMVEDESMFSGKTSLYPQLFTQSDLPTVPTRLNQIEKEREMETRNMPLYPQVETEPILPSVPIGLKQNDAVKAPQQRQRQMLDAHGLPVLPQGN